jgi:hypothetical protein
MVNPFREEETELLHLSSGIVADEAVSTDLLQAKEVGEKACQEFCTARLQTKSVGFSEPLKKRKVLTFGTMGKKKTTKSAGREITFKADKKLFAELILAGSTRKIQLDEMLKNNSGPLPLSISTLHGTLVKTNKATLLHHIEGSVKDPFLQKIPRSSVWVLDGMAILQQLKLRDVASFGDLAQLIFAKIVALASQYRSQEIHFVTDRSPIVSIKNSERSRRAATGSERIHIYSGMPAVPKQWSKFLANGPNKESLIELFFHEWGKYSPPSYQDITIFLAHGQVCQLFVRQTMKYL